MLPDPDTYPDREFVKLDSFATQPDDGTRRVRASWDGHSRIAYRELGDTSLFVQCRRASKGDRNTEPDLVS
jgi:hypothetical protein